MQSRSACTLVVAYLACMFMPGKSAWAQEPPTLEQIIEGIERMEKMFFESESVLIRYERTKADTLIPSSYLGGFLLAEWSQAYRGGKWFSERRYTRPMKTKDLLVPAKPETQVIKDKFLLEWKQGFQSAAIDKFDKGRNIYAGLYYTRNLSLDAPKYIAKSNGVDITAIRRIESYKDYVALPFLPEFLRENKARYKVLPTPENVDGELCWVVAWPEMDRFWVDPQRGFAIPRRIYCWAPGKPRRVEYHHSDYREVKPGLWLPFTQVEDVYTSPIADKDQSLWGKVASRCEYRLHSIEFDHVPDSLFEVKLPPGTRVIDTVRGFNYTVSDDSDPFSGPIEEAKKLQRRSLLYWLLLGGTVFAVGIFLIYWIRQHRRLQKKF
jgi:hypothetical protein